MYDPAAFGGLERHRTPPQYVRNAFGLLKTPTDRMAKPLLRHLLVSWGWPDRVPTPRFPDDPTGGACPSEVSSISPGPPAGWHDHARPPDSAVLPLRITACSLPRPSRPHGEWCPTAEAAPFSRFLRPSGLLSGLNFLGGQSVYRPFPVCAGTPLSRGEGTSLRAWEVSAGVVQPSCSTDPAQAGDA